MIHEGFGSDNTLATLLLDGKQRNSDARSCALEQHHYKQAPEATYRGEWWGEVSEGRSVAVVVLYSVDHVVV